MTSETCRTLTVKTIDSINATRSILATVSNAIIYVKLTVGPVETFSATTDICTKYISAVPLILART